MNRTILLILWILVLLYYGYKEYVQIVGLQMAQDMVYFEQESKRLQGENSILEKEVNESTSLQYAQEVATMSGFIQPGWDKIIILK